MTQITLPMTDATAAPVSGTRPRFDVGPLWILLLALIATLAGWIPGRTLLPDPTSQDPAKSRMTNAIAPSAAFAAESLRQGRLPLWNPHQGSGGPLLGNGEVGALYPTILLHAFLPPKVAWIASAVALYWVSGFGAWWLAKKLNLPVAARLAAAVAYMFNGAMSVWLNQPISQTLLPLTIAACLNLASKPSGWRFALLAMLIGASILGGRPDASVGLIAASVIGWMLLMIGQIPVPAKNRPGGVLFWGGGLLAMLAATALGMMLAGVQWVTWLEYVIDWTPQAFRSVVAAEDRSGARIASMFVVPAIVAIGLASIGIVRGITRGAVAWVLFAAAAITMALHGGAERLVAHRWSLNWMLWPSLLGAATLAIAMLAAIAVGSFRSRASQVCVGLLALNGLAYAIWCNPGSPATDAKSFSSSSALVPPRIALLETMHNRPTTQPVAPQQQSTAGNIPERPRVRIARTSQSVASGSAAMMASTRPSFDPQIVIIDPELAPEYALVKNPADAPYCSLQRSGAAISGRPTIEWIENSPDRARLRINGGYGGWLVMEEPFAPGWKARFVWNVSSTSAVRKKEHDIEKDALIYPAYGWARAIPLPAAAPSQGRRPGREVREVGPCEVVVEFRPRGFKHGWMVSLAGGLVVFMLLAGQLIHERLEPANNRKENANAHRT